MIRLLGVLPMLWHLNVKYDKTGGEVEARLSTTREVYYTDELGSPTTYIFIFPLLCVLCIFLLSCVYCALVVFFLPVAIS